MCTAISFTTDSHYFGRNLDLEYHYNESVVITPQNFPLHFRCGTHFDHHPAIIGMATIADGYPLYYDATNEYGVSIAGLNFPGNAVYHLPNSSNNIAPFELILWVLCQCKTTADARTLLKNTNLWDTPFSPDYPQTPLHWLISDRSGSLVVEPMNDGIGLFDNPINVLTNNPTFSYHLEHLCQYMNITREKAENRFSDRLNLSAFSNGMGGIGLPGDLSSPSRFVRAAFALNNSFCGNSESESISQFFHILDSVAQQRGCARVNNDFEITYYSSCCNTDKGIYYYKTYENSQITAVTMGHEDLSGTQLTEYPLFNEQQVYNRN